MISIRQSKNAKSGLIELINYIKNNINDPAKMRMLEIGSYAGDSSEIFCRYFRSVICVDPWRNGYDDNDAASFQFPMSQVEADFDERMKGIRNFRKRKMKSIDFFSLSDMYFDFIYIDAIHTEQGVKDDLNLSKDKTRLLGGHDFSEKFPGVMKAVSEFALINKKIIKTFSDSSWLLI